MNQHPTHLFAALNAAAHGYAVLPADARTGAPLVPITEASTDPEVIRSWWQTHPAAKPAMLPPKPKGLQATAFAWRDPKTIPPRKYLYGGHLIRKFGSAKFAPGGVGKSILALTEAIAMAMGRALLGVAPSQRCRVWYWNGEDPLEETERRVAAICLHFGIAKEELEGWLFIDSGREQEIVLAVQNPKTGTSIAKPVVESLIDTMLDNQIDVLIIDPFVSSHRVTENDTMAMEMVAKQWTKIADETDAAIELIHHTRKTGGAEATVEDGRGAVAVLAAVRSAQVLNKMTPDEGAKAGVENHREYFKLENGKANLAPPPEGKEWYRIVPVSLGNGDGGLLDNGDSVGVVVRWKWPDPLDGITGADFDKAAAAIRAGRWKESIQAKDWVGRPIAKALALDLDSKSAKAKVKGLIQVWLKAGSLVVVEEKDDHREIKNFVKVADEK